MLPENTLSDAVSLLGLRLIGDMIEVVEVIPVTFRLRSNFHAAKRIN